VCSVVDGNVSKGVASSALGIVACSTGTFAALCFTPGFGIAGEGPTSVEAEASPPSEAKVGFVTLSAMPN